MEDPQLFAGAHIERGHVAFYVVVGRRARRHRRPHDDDVVGNHGRRAVADPPDDITLVVEIQRSKRSTAAVIPKLGIGRPVFALRETSRNPGVIVMIRSSVPLLQNATPRAYVRAASGFTFVLRRLPRP